MKMMSGYGKDGQQQAKQALVDGVQENARKQKAEQQSRLEQRKAWERMKKEETDARFEAKF